MKEREKGKNYVEYVYAWVPLKSRLRPPRCPQRALELPPTYVGLLAKPVLVYCRVLEAWRGSYTPSCSSAPPRDRNLGLCPHFS